ncbi:MAG: hypothetical protein ACXACH_01180 [Candidatus Hermodarchaeia archaeon]|jgi:hypothetical protein
MKRLPTILALLTILVLPLAFSYYSVTPEDCFVQIISVTLNRSSLEVGEKLQVDIVYDLYYDPTDPLGIGSVSVSFAIQGSPISLSSYEFTTTGFDINETVTFDISPIDWTPNATGQIGVVQVEGWVQDSIGTMTDSVQQQFTVERSILLISNTILHIIRPDDVNFTLQLTTLDYQPLFNKSVYLIEVATNSTWSTALTNFSGYAILSWAIAGDFLLGPHEFYLRVQDGLTTLGTIPITMIIYEQTVLELV